MTQHPESQTLTGAVGAPVRIDRDRMGIPHITAANRRDAYLGVGYAMGEDRLWQLEWYRRCAHGRTAEVLGRSHLGPDVEARHVGFTRLAEAAVKALPPSTAEIVNAFAAGISLAIEHHRADLPPEFAAVGVVPDPWTPIDTLAVLSAFWWYLSGRLNWVSAHDVILRTLPERLAGAFLMPTGDVGSIVDPDASPRPDGTGAGDASGSNNWVIGGGLCASGVPLLASDPHVVYSIPSMWYEVQIDCPEEQSAGACYVGTPGFLIGRNPLVAWGFTNNICSNRDLYRERVNPGNPAQYAESAGVWREFGTRAETIACRGEAPIVLTIRTTSRGPIVNEVIDERVRPEEPVSLVWTGMHLADEIGVMLRYHTAADADEFVTALAGWRCPTLNFVFADRKRIGYHCAGELPLRGRRWLGIRDALREDDRWLSVSPTRDMPRVVNPDRGWIVTANNRPSASHEVVGQSGYWPSSLRSERLRSLIEEGAPHDAESMRRMQLDILSLHGQRLAPRLLELLSDADLTGPARRAAALLGAWDGRFQADSAAPTIFETFFLRWYERVAAERFSERLRPILAPQGIGFATALLLAGDALGWFPPHALPTVVREVFEAAVVELGRRLGEDPAGWHWARVHRLSLPHVLDGMGAAAWPFRLEAVPMPGGWNTIDNQLYDANAPFTVNLGPSSRMIADLARPDVLLFANAGGASGDPRSEHYRDGFDEWCRGGYHSLCLSAEDLKNQVVRTTHLVPKHRGKP